MQTLPLRIIIADPPPGVAWAVQLGKNELLAPSLTTPRRLRFDFTVRIGAAVGGAAPRLLGPAVQGPPKARFVYLNSGLRAGQAGSCWDRRAKISLTGITQEMIATALKSGGTLVAEFAGTGRDGGPACASVPLLGRGWQLE